MRATYDPEADALSIDLQPRRRRARTVKIARGILLHLDRRQHPIEVEVLGASAHCSLKLLQLLEPAGSRRLH